MPIKMIEVDNQTMDEMQKAPVYGIPTCFSRSPDGTVRKYPLEDPEICHCGKNGHALNSINCPIHGESVR